MPRFLSAVVLILLFPAIMFCQDQQEISVRLISFESRVVGTGHVKFSFIATSENDLKEYLVFRSVDNENWFVVWNFKPRNVAGDHYYEFTDKTANGGVNYYKLEVYSNGGQSKTLQREFIELEDLSKAIFLEAVPSKNQIKLESAEQIFTMQLELSDIFGRIYPVSYGRETTHSLTLFTIPLEQGVYYLKCYLNESRYVRKKLMILPH